MKKDIKPIIVDYLKTQPIDKAWLFGSYSRGEATRKSDVDILVRFTPNSRISLLKHAGMAVALEELLKKKVDLVEEGQLCDFAVESVEQDKILIYERAVER
jgi:predicted nucleotidyltransferase